MTSSGDSVHGHLTAGQEQEPEAVTTHHVDWMIYNPVSDAYLFSGDRVDCERWMQRLWKSHPAAVLVREDVRTRSQTWRTGRAVVPWSSPCEWVAEGDENGNQIGPAWCMAHKHREGTEPPGECWRPPHSDGTSGA